MSRSADDAEKEDSGLVGRLRESLLAEDPALALLTVVAESADDNGKELVEAAKAVLSTKRNASKSSAGSAPELRLVRKGSLAIMRRDTKTSVSLASVQPQPERQVQKKKTSRKRLVSTKMVTRGALTVLKRGGSQSYGAREEESWMVESVPVPEDIIRGPMGAALMATPGHRILVKPLIDAARLPDIAVADDYFVEVAPRARKVSNIIMLVGLLMICVLGPWCPAFLTFGAMRATGSEHFFLAAREESWNVTQESEVPPPWGNQWAAISLVLTNVFNVCIVYSMLLNTLRTLHPVAMQLLWLQNKMRLIAVIGSTIAYAVSTAVLLPTKTHLLWLFARSIIVLFTCMLDPVMITLKLRYKPDRMAALLGSKSGGRGIFTRVMILTSVGYMLSDIFRHNLMLFATERSDSIDFGIGNPTNGNELAISNHQIADSMYVTNLIFVGATVSQANIVRTGDGIRFNFSLPMPCV